MSGELPEGWRWVELGDVTRSAQNVDPRRKPQVGFTYIDIASVDRLAKAIVDPKILLGEAAPSRARRRVQRDDVIVSTTRPNLNAVALIPEALDAAVCSTGFCVLRCEPDVNPRYVYRLVQSKSFIDEMTYRMTGASYPAVTDKVVRSYTFPLPPLDEQRRIVARLEEQIAAADRTREAAAAQLAAIEAIPAALLREIFPPSPAAR